MTEMKEYSKVIEENNNGIFIITKDDCPLCVSLKELFDTIEVEYKTYKYVESDEVDETLPFKTEMKEKTKGTKFPFCYFNGNYVGGYKEVHGNLITGKLQEQLNEIGIEYEEDF
jgi:glutaredoxin